MKIDAEKAKPDRVLYFGFKTGLYELKDEHWIPVPAIIIDGDKDNILAEIERLEENGVPHRVLQYNKDCLMVERRVEFVN